MEIKNFAELSVDKILWNQRQIYYKTHLSMVYDDVYTKYLMPELVLLNFVKCGRVVKRFDQDRATTETLLFSRLRYSSDTRCTFKIEFYCGNACATQRHSDSQAMTRILISIKQLCKRISHSHTKHTHTPHSHTTRHIHAQALKKIWCCVRLR